MTTDTVVVVFGHKSFLDLIILILWGCFLLVVGGFYIAYYIQDTRKGP